MPTVYSREWKKNIKDCVQMKMQFKLIVRYVKHLNNFLALGYITIWLVNTCEGKLMQLSRWQVFVLIQLLNKDKWVACEVAWYPKTNY